MPFFSVQFGWVFLISSTMWTSVWEMSTLASLGNFILHTGQTKSMLMSLSAFGIAALKRAYLASFYVYKGAAAVRAYADNISGFKLCGYRC